MPRTREYWLQIENHTWDASPWGFDRASGRKISRKAGGAFRPVLKEVLAIRRYAPNFSAPEDQPLNPWDLNESATPQMGVTIPGAVLEAKVADEIVVHFRNHDMRQGVSEARRTHSLHPRGIQREALYNGAYPLSPPDPAQGGQRGDRVAPGETFIYRWTCPQRASAGAWLFYDAAQAGQESVRLGAFGVLAVRSPGEQAPDLPAGPLRSTGDTPVSFASVPEPPKRSESVLAFHELPAIGLCLNGRQALGNTPSLVVGEGTRMTIRFLNATQFPLSVSIQGHRWEAGGRWVDSELLPPLGSATLSILSASAEGGGGLGEWLVTGRSASAEVSGTLVTTTGGKLELAG